MARQRGARTAGRAVPQGGRLLMGPGTLAGGGQKGRRRPRAWGGRRRGPGADHASLREALLSLLESMGGTPERAGLQRLWDNWETALGAELANMAQPLGHRRAPKGGEPARQGLTLLLGAEDAMLLQELRFRGEEILERVNGFLGRACFCEVQVSLPLGRGAPARSRERPSLPDRDEPGGPAAARGIFLAGMDRDSPVARCYARFARRADRGEGKDGAEHEENQKK